MRHGARIGQQQYAGLGQYRVASLAREQGNAYLPFQIGDGLADNRLRAVETPPGRRKTAFIRGGDKNAQLVEGYPIQHVYPLIHLQIRYYLS